MRPFPGNPITTATAVILTFAVLALSACIVSGYFTPLQTSRITELGVCLSENEYAPAAVVPAHTENLFVCGKVTGSTRRTAWFFIYGNDRAVAHTSATVGPGTFFISRILWSSPLLPGEHKIEAGYERLPVISAKFLVH